MSKSLTIKQIYENGWKVYLEKINPEKGSGWFGYHPYLRHCDISITSVRYNFQNRTTHCNVCGSIIPILGNMTDESERKKLITMIRLKNV